MSAFYGGTLSYDLMREYSKATDQFSDPDVRLRSGGTTLKYDHGGTSTHPGGGSSGVWTSYTVRLDESAAWMVKTREGTILLPRRARYRRYSETWTTSASGASST